MAAEQLSFRLDPALPAPGAVAPMWPVPRPDAFDSPDHLFEPTWGGHRVIAFVGPAERARHRRRPHRGPDRPRPRAAPPGAERPRRPGRGAIRGPRRGARRGRRRRPGRRRGAPVHGSTAAPGRPVALLVFDILHLDGVWLLRTPLEKRRATLKKALRPGDEVVVVPAIAGEGRALHDAVSAQGIAGVLARRRTSPYLPGVRSKLWRSIVASEPGRRHRPHRRPRRSEDDATAAGRPRCSRCSGGCRSTRSPRRRLGARPTRGACGRTVPIVGGWP